MTGDRDGDASGPDIARTPSVLVAIRARSRRRALALVVAASVGIGLAWIHWLGLFLAGGLVGLVSRTVPRAVLAGLAVGVLVSLAQVLVVPGMDAGAFVAFRPPAYLTVGAAFGAPVWGSLIRAVV